MAGFGPAGVTWPAGFAAGDAAGEAAGLGAEAGDAAGDAATAGEAAVAGDAAAAAGDAAGAVVAGAAAFGAAVGDAAGAEVHPPINIATTSASAGTLRYRSLTIEILPRYPCFHAENRRSTARSTKLIAATISIRTISPAKTPVAWKKLVAFAIKNPTP